MSLALKMLILHYYKSPILKLHKNEFIFLHLFFTQITLKEFIITNENIHEYSILTIKNLM